jgi:L-ascorbate metabolism protein UlaG (beta-lactamase superfamily)
MKITRTANAGVLLELDGVSILMDGVCREVKPYPATPPEVKRTLMEHFPDVVAFTHAHKDHYDPAFAALYQKQTSGVILGPATLPGCKATMEDTVVKGVYILPVSSRHIGLAGKDVEHASFIVQGSRCVWFLGDAAPMQWRGKDLPKPDVLIVPYAYANTPSGWSLTRSLGADHVVLLHMPKREEDTIGLWDAVNAVLKSEEKQPAILSMSETIEI